MNSARYKRQMILPEIGDAGQKKLSDASVIIIGAGGLGCPVLQYLAAAGIGQIGIVDNDIVDETNLNRQILYSPDDIGKSKSEVAAKKISSQNPEIKISFFNERLAVENAKALLQSYDIIIDGSDNFSTRYIIDDTCSQLHKAVVFGSIYRYEGQVSVFNYKDGPSYRDIYPEPSELGNCEDIGVLGVLPGIVGSYMAAEAIKIICEIGDVLSGKLLVADILENSINIYSIGKPKLNSMHQVDPSITIDTLKEWMEKKSQSIHIVDVRESYEYEEKNIGGINISLFSLQDRLHELPPNKDIIFICQMGNRSRMAYNIAKEKLSNKLYFLASGF